MDQPLARVERATAEIRAATLEQLRLLRVLCAQGGSCDASPCPDCARMRQALCETIGVLEATRGSFKSRQLCALRRRLMDVLAQ